MISLLFSILLLGIHPTHSSIECQSLEDDIYFAGYPSDLQSLGNCSNLNSSLFITGDYNIWSLEHLQNLNNIQGYLVVLDSHLIKNLQGLQNLERIQGNELYLKTASVTFKYNNNFLDDENRGLCYTNLVNWTKITDYDVVDTNNGINCPESCHAECVGCFGPGPRLCQECLHTQVGDTCVNYNCQENSCLLEKPQTPLTLTFDRIEFQSLNVSWNSLNITEAGGNILEYLLYRNGELISHQYFNDSGYETLDTLPTFFVDTGLPLNLYHFYRIAYVTESGTLTSDEFSYNMYDWRPDDIRNLSLIDFINQNEIKVQAHINFHSQTNGIPYQFHFTLFQDGILQFQNQPLTVQSDADGINKLTLKNLFYETDYKLEVYGYNQEYNVPGEISTLDFTTPLQPTSTSTTTNTITTTTVSTTSTVSSTSTISSTSTVSSTTTESTLTLTTSSVSTITTKTITTTTGTSSTDTTLTDTTLSTSTDSSSSTSTQTSTSSILTHTSTNTNSFSVTDSTTARVNKGMVVPTVVNTLSNDFTTPDVIKVIDLEPKIQNLENKTFIQTHNTTLTNKKDKFPWFIILIIIISILAIILCLYVVCHICETNNEVGPLPSSIGYGNPCYETEILDTDITYQTAQSKPSNPIYSSDSSLNSVESASQNNYNRLDRKTTNKRTAVVNDTYGMVQSDNSQTRNILANETYGFPEQPTQDQDGEIKEENNYDYCVDSHRSSLSVSKVPMSTQVRPSSAYQNITRTQTPESNKFKIEPGLKRYRPTVRKDITDESIGRRKGNLMNELQMSIKNKQANNFEI